MKKLVVISIYFVLLVALVSAVVISSLSCSQEPPQASRTDAAALPQVDPTDASGAKSTAQPQSSAQAPDQRQIDEYKARLREQLGSKRRPADGKGDVVLDTDEAGVQYPEGRPDADSRKVPVLGDVPLVGGLYRVPKEEQKRAAQESLPATPKSDTRRGSRIKTHDWPTAYVPQELTTIPVGSYPQRKRIDLVSVTEDEIWVIARPEALRAVGPEYETPGSGAMLAQIREEKIPLPLKHTAVKGHVSGYIAAVEVTQQFQNPFSEKIEAVYVFPLPQNAAVNEFIMVIGERRIRGIIRERQEAEQIYQEARRQGYVASLLTQERPNIFTQKVANIEPGKQIDVNIKYFNTLAYVDGWYEFTFPMVVGPRFNPPGSTDGVGAVGRGKTGLSGQSTEVQYLKPHERSGHDISLAVDIDAGVKIEELACASHAIKKDFDGKEKVRVQLSPLDNIPNKDFVLRYKVAGGTVKSALVTHRDKRGGFFTLMLYPPDDLKRLERSPMEMVFVLDCSGSMNGQPIAKSKEAVKRALRKLEPDDTFQVIEFSISASQLGPDPVPATSENVQKAIRYVDSLQGSGGTMMIEGIKAALDFPHDSKRFRLVSFMTDGYIGNEAEILGEIHKRLGESRIFSFGIGSSVNRYLLDRMAKLGRGAVAYIGLNDSGTEVVDRFYDCISHPALTDVHISYGDMEVSEVYPQQVPDLFVGRPIILTGRFQGQTDTTITVGGRLGEARRSIRIPVTFDEAAATHPGIACVWARKRIEDLASQATRDSELDVSSEIKHVALQYGLMSAYTAFLAVDSTQTTQGDHGVTVAVPVPVPDGVRYDTTVQD